MERTLIRLKIRTLETKAKDNPDFSRYDENLVAKAKPRPYSPYIPDYSDPAGQLDDAVTETIALL